jgi:predicted Abi (CAAX) family protease
MIHYLKNNLLLGLKTSPSSGVKYSLGIAVSYALIAFAIGSSTDLFRYEFIDSDLILLLPLTLFIFPSLLEESLFRGVLIPNKTKEKGVQFTLWITLLSTVSFVVWHPLNALTINTAAQGFFLNPFFLAVVFFLGLACSLSYIISQSLWVPVILHWLTVLVWVYCLGGRNIVLE